MSQTVESPRPSVTMEADITSPSRVQKFRWVGELLLLRSFEFSYMKIKDLAQTADAKARAYRNAHRLVEFERSLHIFIEPHLQRLALDATLLVRFMNLYYTMMHFTVTAGVLLWLYLRRRPFYSHARTVLLVSSMLALIGYFAFPLQPPRLYPCDCFVDTLDVVGGSWSYYSNQVRHIANPYAAMPSVHFTWALWSAIALYRFGGRRWLRVAAVTHAVLTLLAIVLTGNHYLLDAAGGALVLGAGSLIVNLVKGWRSQSSGSSGPLETGGAGDQLTGVGAR